MLQFSINLSQNLDQTLKNLYQSPIMPLPKKMYRIFASWYIKKNTIHFWK